MRLNNISACFANRVNLSKKAVYLAIYFDSVYMNNITEHAKHVYCIQNVYPQLLVSVNMYRIARLLFGPYVLSCIYNFTRLSSSLNVTIVRRVNGAISLGWLQYYIT